jgi:hypothetical protein
VRGVSAMYCIKANCVREYESLLTDQREALTEFNRKRLTIMYFNGDVCDGWKKYNGQT